MRSKPRAAHVRSLPASQLHSPIAHPPWCSLYFFSQIPFLSLSLSRSAVSVLNSHSNGIYLAPETLFSPIHPTTIYDVFGFLSLCVYEFVFVIPVSADRINLYTEWNLFRFIKVVSPIHLNIVDDVLGL